MESRDVVGGQVDGLGRLEQLVQHLACPVGFTALRQQPSPGGQHERRPVRVGDRPVEGLHRLVEASLFLVRESEPERRGREGRSQPQRAPQLLDGLVVVAGVVEAPAELHVEDQGERIEGQGAPRLGDGLLVAAQEGQVLGEPVVGGRVAGVQLERPAEPGLRALPVPVVEELRQGQRAVRFGQSRIELQRLPGRLLGPREDLPRRPGAVVAEEEQRVREAGPGQGVRRIAVERLLEVADALLQVPRRPLVPEVAALEIEVVGLEVLRADAGPGLDPARLPQGDLELAGDGGGDLVLDGEDVARVAVEALRPELISGPGVGQLRGDANAFSRPAHAALQHGSHVERRSDLLDVRFLALEREAGRARGHAQLRHPAQSAQDLLGDAVAEELVLRIGAEVGERQHGDRLVVRCSCGSGGREAAG